MLLDGRRGAPRLRGVRAGRVRRAGRRRLSPPRPAALRPSRFERRVVFVVAGSSIAQRAERRCSSLRARSAKSASAQSEPSARKRGACPLADFQRSSSSSASSRLLVGRRSPARRRWAARSSAGGARPARVGGRLRSPPTTRAAASRSGATRGSFAPALSAAWTRSLLDSDSDSVRPCDDADHVGSPSNSKSVARSPQNSSESSTARSAAARARVVATARRARGCAHLRPRRAVLLPVRLQNRADRARDRRANRTRHPFRSDPRLDPCPPEVVHPGEARRPDLPIDGSLPPRAPEPG